MDDNRVEGSAREGLGRLQDTWGAATADPGIQVRGKFNQLRGATQRVYGESRDDLANGVEEIVGQLRVMLQDKIELVTRKPLLSVGAAVGLGLIMGLMHRSRRPTRVVYVRR